MFIALALKDDANDKSIHHLDHKHNYHHEAKKICLATLQVLLLKKSNNVLSICCFFLKSLFRMRPPWVLCFRWCDQCLGATGEASVWQSGFRHCHVDNKANTSLRIQVV